MAQRSFKDGSKANWVKIDSTVPNPTDIGFTNDDIKTGCLMRIADATELMAKNYIQLQKDYDRINSSLDYWREMYYKLERRFSAQKGVITKLKKKASGK